MTLEDWKARAEYFEKDRDHWKAVAESFHREIVLLSNLTRKQSDNSAQILAGRPTFPALEKKP